MSTLEKAIHIAAKAHAGVLDKAGQPYLLHPLRVMFAVSKAAQIPAVLHDVVEDSKDPNKFTLDDLRAEGFSAGVIEAVQLLTKAPADKADYFSYIRRVATHPIAREVKLADLRDNLDLSRIAHPTDKDWDRCKKYTEALAILEASGQ